MAAFAYRSPPLLLVCVLGACEPALAAEPAPVEGGSRGEQPGCGVVDEHTYVEARVLGPRAWSDVSPAWAEAGAVFETRSGAHAAYDLFHDRERSLTHLELWLDGERVQLATADEGTYVFDPLVPPGVDEGTSAAAALLLARRLAAADCPDCCQAARRMAFVLSGGVVPVQPPQLSDACDPE